ncbi:MAG: MotA/TolQ/ExbB proton channel family protein [Gammaproteobacteria bacterium]|nr:MotA/TolQ/ExbB proton channel family protein [Pseudomonadales bacterium]MCP5348089.1 MotA/TolQ/ExbB proton channel family protein [Pseudomonadales bacterium]
MLAELFYQSELLAGGWVMVAILVLSTLMWILILDRYLFLWRQEKTLAREIVSRWQANRSDSQLANRRLRAGLTATFQSRLSTWIGTIQVITAILPLLGLLGTVSGMIKTFEVMTVFGNGNVRGMAEGISQALVTTMAGLLTAVAGMYFANDLQQRFDRETERLAEDLDANGGPDDD